NAIAATAVSASPPCIMSRCSAGPWRRRAVRADPMACPIRSAPAAARPAVPPTPRRRGSWPPPAGRTRRRCSSTISVAWPRSSRYEQAHVDPVLGGATKGLHVRGRARVIRVGEPQRAAREGGHQGIEPVEAGRARRRGHDAERHLAFVGARPRLRSLFLWQRAPARRPGLGEGPGHVGDGGAEDLDAGVPPAGESPLGPTLPDLPDAQAADEGHAPVHDQALAVVAGDPSQRLEEARRVEAADLDATLAQPAPQAVPPDAKGTLICARAVFRRGAPSVLPRRGAYRSVAVPAQRRGAAASIQ